MNAKAFSCERLPSFAGSHLGNIKAGDEIQLGDALETALNGSSILLSQLKGD